MVVVVLVLVLEPRYGDYLPPTLNISVEVKQTLAQEREALKTLRLKIKGTMGESHQLTGSNMAPVPCTWAYQVWSATPRIFIDFLGTCYWYLARA